jgi:hypothetical protein
LKKCDENIEKTFSLIDKMIRLANRGDEDREDTGCGILYGVMRDSAYKLKKLAETEKRNHRRKYQ